MDFDGFDDLADALNTFQANVEEAEDRLEPVIDQAVQKTAARVEGSAKGRVPVDTGNLRASIGYQRVESGRYVVGTPVEYAEYVEKGTSAHTITPDGEFLVFEGSDGGTVFARSVDHPGTEPNPFLRPAMLEHRDDLASDIEEAIAELLDEIF